MNTVDGSFLVFVGKLYIALETPMTRMTQNPKLFTKLCSSGLHTVRRHAGDSRFWPVKWYLSLEAKIQSVSTNQPNRSTIHLININIQSTIHLINIKIIETTSNHDIFCPGKANSQAQPHHGFGSRAREKRRLRLWCCEAPWQHGPCWWTASHEQWRVVDV